MKRLLSKISIVGLIVAFVAVSLIVSAQAEKKKISGTNNGIVFEKS